MSEREKIGSYKWIIVDVDEEGIAWLTFNRPHKRNAMNLTMVREIRDALSALKTRSDVRVLIFKGAGEKAFVGGADLAELLERDKYAALNGINSSLFREIECFPCPTIAAIRGFALGGGCELAIACDLRICGVGAKLGQPEVGLGIIPGAGATYRLPKLIGVGRARELIFSGRIVAAGEAQNIGLVNRVVPDHQLMDAALEMAREIARNSPLAVRMAKIALSQAGELSVSAGQALESAIQAVLFEDEEKQRRMTAFLERRTARIQSGQRADESSLKVKGAVENLVNLGHGELLAFPPATQVVDVSKLVPKKVGSAVRLGAVLAWADPKPAARFVTVTSEDGEFSATGPREEMERALIVYSLNGQPLPEDKGGPFRLLIPDARDKCQNIKAVGTIEVTPHAGANKCQHSEDDHKRIRSQF